MVGFLWTGLLCSYAYTFWHVFHEQHWWFKNVEHGACIFSILDPVRIVSAYRLERWVVQTWVQSCSNSIFEFIMGLPSPTSRAGHMPLFPLHAFFLLQKNYSHAALICGSHYPLLSLPLQQWQPKAGTAVITQRWQHCSPLSDVTVVFSSCNNTNWKCTLQMCRCIITYNFDWSELGIQVSWMDPTQGPRWVGLIEGFLTLQDLCANEKQFGKLMLAETTCGACCGVTTVMEKEGKRQERDLVNWLKHIHTPAVLKFSCYNWWE